MLFAADETSVSRTPSVVGTWAPVGETPILRHDARRGRFSALVLLSPCGLLFRDTVEKSFTGTRILLNLKALFETVKGQIVVLLDGASIHWTAEIADWLGQPEVAARLTVERFPPYSPHLNPVELLNAAAKRRMGNYAADTMEVLHAKFQAAFATTAQQASNYFRAALGPRFAQCQVVV
jgi:hypothetical protein